MKRTGKRSKIFYYHQRKRYSFRKDAQIQLEEARKEAMVDKDHHYSSQIAWTRMEIEINTWPDDRLLAHHITRNFEVPAQVVEKC